MHGHRCDEKQQRHMWPAPFQRPAPGTIAESSGVKCFSKEGRKVNIGDCALFQAGTAPPFIGIIRKLIPEKEGVVKLGVNWLYRPADVRLAKGAPLEAAPNEIFYSFHKDEISTAFLLHPCKVAFLRKGVELPAGVSSFVCRRVYDIANKCLWWLTDRDYTDEHQEEVDLLLDRTKHIMQAAVQSGGPSSRAPTGPTSQQPKTSSEVVQNAAFSVQSKGNLKRECSMKPDEIANIIDKDGGLANLPSVDQLVHLMQQERIDSTKNAGEIAVRRTVFANIIASTEKEDCLNRFVQLGGLRMLDDWLQEAHKGKIGDGGSPKEGDKRLEDLLLTLLRALDKLPVDLDALKTWNVGKSVNNLRSHKNVELQKKARKLVETWKKRVDAEMKMSGDSKSGSSPGIPWSNKQPSTDIAQPHPIKQGIAPGVVKSSSGLKSNGTCSGDTMTKSCAVSAGGGKVFPVLSSNVATKENHAKLHVSGNADVPLLPVKEEKSSSSSQSQNSQSFSSGTVKGVASSRKEETKSSTFSAGTKVSSSTMWNHSFSVKGHQPACFSGSQKDLVGGKPLIWSRSSVNEKSASPGSLDNGLMEIGRAETANNQRLIVRLPNPGRSPARNASGGSAVDVLAPTNRGSSPNPSERNYLADGKNKMQFPEASIDVRSGSGGKSGADCGEGKERSPSVPADHFECKASDSEVQASSGNFNCTSFTNKVSAEALESGEGKKGVPASSAAVSSIDSHAAHSQVHGRDSDEGGIGLLASVAAIENSEVEKGFDGVTQMQGVFVKHSNQEPERSPMEAESLNHNDTTEKLSGLSGEGDEKERKGDDNSKILPAHGWCSERTEARAFPRQEPSGATETNVEHGIMEKKETQEERNTTGCAPTSAEFVMVKDVCGPAGRGAEDSFGFEDGSVAAKVARREIGSEENTMNTRSGTELCNGSSLTRECQSGIAEHMDDTGSPEDVKKIGLSRGTLSRLSLAGDVQKVEEMVSGYYEEDALEVARQVAMEVEQEVESYGKPDTQDVSTATTGKNEDRKETTIFDGHKSHWSHASEIDTMSRGEDGSSQCRQDINAAKHSDNSQETITAKRKDTGAGRAIGGEDGEEVNQGPSKVGSPNKTEMDIVSVPGSVADASEEQKKVVSLEEHSHSLQPLIPDQLLDSAVCSIHERDAVGTDAASIMASDEQICGATDAPGRPVFDLNEGIVAEESLQDGSTVSTISPVIPVTLFPSTSSSLFAAPSCLATPIAVVAATKGAFIPPTNPLGCKAEPGWKGSAATSAFRPAEPRRTPERQQATTDAFAGDAIGRRQNRPLDIDLNVVDESVLEEVGTAATLPSQSSVLCLNSSFQAPSTFSTGCLSNGCSDNSGRTQPRLDLDLNRAEEAEEGATSLISDSPGAEGIGSSTQNCNSSSSTIPRVMLDFDLNDGPLLEDATGDEPAVHQKNVKNFENPVLPVLSGLRMNPEVINVAPWFPSGSAIPMLAMPGLSAAKVETPYPVVATATGKPVLSTGPSLSPFAGDLYRAGAVIPSSPAVSYSTTMPAAFPYAGFPPGSNFPFTSASFAMSSTPYLESSASAPFSAIPSQLVSAGAVVSPYGRPYLVGITDISGPENETTWSRPSLDLNAGPDPVDADIREDRVGTRQVPAAGQIPFQQAGTPGGPSKRKEPEGGFDPFRAGFKQTTWR